MNSTYTQLIGRYSEKDYGYYETERPEMLPFVPTNASAILEVGCGSGGFGRLIKKHLPAAAVWGIEPDSGAASLARNSLDRVIQATFTADLHELRGSSFDVICFNDVLEHLANPEHVLIDARRLLSPNGVIVASIPNILFFYQILEILKDQDWRYRDSGILDNTHLRFFTKKSIVRLFECCGYEIIRIEGINPSYGNMFRIFRLLTLGHISDWKYVQFAVQAKAVTTN